MPGLNGTGPQGQGPMTGRGMGRCNPAAGANTVRGFGMGFARGLGRGRGFGAGRGFRFRNTAPLPQDFSTQDRIAELEAQLAGLQQELTSLRQQHEDSDHQR